MKYDEFIELFESVTRAFFGLLFGLLIGTTILLQGELIGIVFYPAAIFSAVWLSVLLKKLKKKETEDKK